MSIRSNYSVQVQSTLQEFSLTAKGADTETRKFLRSALLFLLIAFLLYLGAYVVSDQLIYKFAKRNRFYVVKKASFSEYDYVILGASHAAAFDYEDMNAQLESMTRSKILNLSVVGGGINVNRLLLDYFLAEHKTSAVVYVVDSFAFYSRAWNEERLNDTRLFDRAPFDPTLVQVLLQNPESRSVGMDYVLGFSKINNADRLKLDVSDDEATKFRTTFRPVKQIDTQRIEYLYPKAIDPQVFQHYLGESEDMIRFVKQRGIRLIAIKPPIPARFYQLLPNEVQFDQALKAMLDQNGIELHDFSLMGNDEKFYFNPDHLNRNGVLNFFENYLKAIMSRR